MSGIIGGNLFDTTSIKFSIKLTPYMGENTESCNDNVFMINSILPYLFRKQKTFKDCSIAFDGFLWESKGNDANYIVFLYKNKGETAFETLQGSFTFALHDFKRQKIFLVKHFPGVVPLHYMIKDNRIAFASQLKNFIPLHPVKGEVFPVLPGTLNTFDLRTGSFTTHTFYKLPKYKRYIDYKEDTIAKKVKSLLEESVLKHLVSDYPIAVSLSGGIDSSAIAYLYKKHYSKNPVAYTVSVGDSKRKRGDLYHARITAEHLGIELREIVLEENYIKNVKKAIWVSEFSDWRQIANALTQKAIAETAHKDGFRILLSGDGADGIHATYPFILRFYDGEQYDDKRRKLVNTEYKAEPIRGYNSSMFGGPVYYRMPFLYIPFIEYCVNIHPKYKKHKKYSKYFLRYAFRNDLPEKITFRRKIVMQKGTYTFDFYKALEKSDLEATFDKLFFKQRSFNLQPKRRYLVNLPYPASTNKYPRYFPYPLNLLAIQEKNDILVDLNLQCFGKTKKEIYEILDKFLSDLEDEEIIINCGDYAPDGDKYEYFIYFISKLESVTIYGSFLLFKSKINELKTRVNIIEKNIFNDWSNINIPLYMLELYPRVNGKIKANLNFSIGCPRKCSYCPTGPIYKQSYKILPLYDIFLKIYNYYVSGVRFFNFIDDNIAASPKKFYIFLFKLKKVIEAFNMQDAVFQSQEGFEIEALAYYGICKLLKETNWVDIKVGLENINPKFLKEANKPFKDNLEVIDKMLKSTKRAGLKITAYYLIGYSETVYDIEANLRFIAKHKLGLRINILREYEGTQYEQNRKLSDKQLRYYKSLAYAIAWLGFEKGIDAYSKTALKEVLDKFKLTYKRTKNEHIFNGKIYIGFATRKLIKILQLILDLDNCEVQESKTELRFIGEQ